MFYVVVMFEDNLFPNTLCGNANPQPPKLSHTPTPSTTTMLLYLTRDWMPWQGRRPLFIGSG